MLSIDPIRCHIFHGRPIIIQWIVDIGSYLESPCIYTSYISRWPSVALPPHHRSVYFQLVPIYLLSEEMLRGV